MVTIATYNEPAKAKQLKEKLQAAGVKADVNNEGNLQTFAFMSKPQANVKVNVEEPDFARAQELMLEWETTNPEIATPIRCPQCNSPRIEYPLLPRRFLTPALAGILFALRIFEKEFYCRDCQFTWANDGKN
jgi:predicted Zn-ribbon and HTH transcriptional regulator